MRYILALDQGTTGSTALLLDRELKVVARAYQELPQHYPQPGWVSHDAEEIWQSVLTVLRGVLHSSGVQASDVDALGLTNQRETSILWDRATGMAVAPAIVWQCRRSSDIVTRWLRDGEHDIVERTGLVPDAYFSASKIRWWLEDDRSLHTRCLKGELAFGTVDAFLCNRLTGQHRTEPSNASRTMVYNLDGHWDGELLERFEIPLQILPEVVPSVGEFGVIKKEWLGAEIPLLGIAGDQQAAMFGQCCTQAGEVKNTYGTGCFLMMNTGDKKVYSKHRLLTTVAWQIGENLEYALEGSVFSAGSAVQWLRDGMGIIQKASETEALASSVTSSDGVVFVPAFTGLGAPYWDSGARGALFGVTRGTRREHLVRAVLESVAFQTRDVVDCMALDLGHQTRLLRVDGGMVANNFLMQFQSDLLGVAVERPVVTESTAYGAGCLAALGAGWYSSSEEIRSLRAVDKVFYPGYADETLYAHWKKAVARTRGWV